MSKDPTYKIYRRLELQNSSLIIGWFDDVGKLGARVVDYLNKKLNAQEFGEIEPVDFFPLGGVAVEDDVAQFPESKFFCCPEKNLVLLKSNAPHSEWYKFLNTIFNIAEDHCKVSEVYTIGGMVALSAHTTPRQLHAVSNTLRMKTLVSQYDLSWDMDYETPPGQRPTLSSFLLWVAQKRGISAASLWIPIPFYMLAAEDTAACKKVVEFFNARFNLGIDTSDLDEKIRKQYEKIARIRFNYPQVDAYIRNLESNIPLSQEESEKLARDIEEYLKRLD